MSSADKPAVKGVIVAAGYGSRLLPITRVVPKELLPLVDRPAIDFIIDEFAAAGISDVLLITSRRKRALEDWFDRDPELEAVFEADGATAKLERARPPAVQAFSVRQARMGGTGDALRLVRAFAGADPVVVAYPDDLFSGPNVSAALISAWSQTGASVLVAEDLTGTDVSRYGVLDAEREGDVLRVRGIVEKPAPGTEPSHWVTYGRYLYTPRFFEHLERRAAEHAAAGSGEFYPMGAMEDLAAEGQLVSAILQGERRDTGTTLGYVQAFVEEALARDDLGPELRTWLKERL